ncbi:MAG TPA: BolA family protein [Acidiferrobacter sp.]|nr:BolA family protein [Acidiferrobacter sp.]
MSLRDDIEERLRIEFAPEDLEVGDDSRHHIGHAGAKGGGHYTVLIVAEGFRGHSLLDRHRLVYDALAPLRQNIHALSIRALAPGEI